MNKYILGLMGATLAWGLSFSLVKQAVELVGLWPFFCVRFWFAALFLALIFRQSILTLMAKRARAAFVLAGLLFFNLWLQTRGIATISASRSGFITSFYVPMTPVLGWLLFKRKVFARQWFLVLLACIGLGILSFPESEAANSSSAWWQDIKAGDIWTIGCALAAALHIVMTENLAKDEDNPISLGFWQFIFAGFFFTTGAVAQTFGSEVSGSLAFWNWPQRALVCVGLTALLATTFAFTMQIICQRKVESVKASIIFALEAPFATLFGVALLGDRLTNLEMLGGILLFTACCIPDKPKRVRETIS